VFGPIWQTWDAKSAQAQAVDALRADQAVTERFESWTPRSGRGCG
jgi:hypothetical protein